MIKLLIIGKSLLLEHYAQYSTILNKKEQIFNQKN